MKRPWGDGSVWRFHGATGAEGQSLSWAISREHVDSWRVGERKRVRQEAWFHMRRWVEGAGIKATASKGEERGKKTSRDFTHETRCNCTPSANCPGVAEGAGQRLEK